MNEMKCGCKKCMGLKEPDTALHICVEPLCHKIAMLGKIIAGPEVVKMCNRCFSYYQALRRDW